MPFDPVNEIAKEMRKKMGKIFSPSPALCIANKQGKILYIDEEKALNERLDYIKEYIKINFGLIEQGQYSFPISGTLLGFFRMTSHLMFILYGEAGKIGNLLLFRGLLQNYGEIIDELNVDLQSMEEMEKNANLVIRLTKKLDVPVPAFIEKVSPHREGAASSKYVEIVGTVSSSEASGTADLQESDEFYPELLERYRNKKFNFKEGIILQYCDGQLSLEEIVKKCKYPKEEVLEIINTLQKKGWLIAHRKKGTKVLGKLIEAISSTQEELSSKPSLASKSITPTDEPLTMFPELLEKYRNKKFNFKEGIILQYCDGKASVGEIAKKSNFSEDEVLEVINFYMKKDWLVVHM